MSKARTQNAIGPMVQKHRTHQGLTQQELAARCNLAGLDIGRETISQIERSVRKVSDLEMLLLAQALGVCVSELVPKTLPKWKRDLRPPTASGEE